MEALGLRGNYSVTIEYTPCSQIMHEDLYLTEQVNSGDSSMQTKAPSKNCSKIESDKSIFVKTPILDYRDFSNPTFKIVYKAFKALDSSLHSSRKFRIYIL